MGCLTFDTIVENRSLPAFSLGVITGISPLLAFAGVRIISLCCCFFLWNEKSEYVLSVKLSLFIKLSATSLLSVVRSFSFADDRIIILGNDIVPFLRKAKV